MKIFLYGVSGVGKTTISKKLALDSSLEYIRGDSIKWDGYDKSDASSDDPYRDLSTKSAWTLHGDMSYENMYRGIVGFRVGINRYFFKVHSDRDNYVLDASFVDPSLAMQVGEVKLIVCNDEAEHARRFFTRESKTPKSHNEKRFARARLQQQVLIDEAQKLGIEIVDSSASSPGIINV